MDNAAMIAVAGYFRAQRGDFIDPTKLQADPNMDIL
jgi:tRNA A37 threonylcarbamoyltransferase TsaD